MLLDMVMGSLSLMSVAMFETDVGLTMAQEACLSVIHWSWLTGGQAGRSFGSIQMGCERDRQLQGRECLALYCSVLLTKRQSLEQGHWLPSFSAQLWILWLHSR